LLLKWRLDLQAPAGAVKIEAPLGMHVSHDGQTLYVASGQNHGDDPNDTTIYALSTLDGALQGTTTIRGMQLATSITEAPATRTLWVAGFRMPEVEVRKKVTRIRGLLEDTLRLTLPEADRAAERLFREPSMHILGTGLIGLAREGALKIREVVLNHSEGYDAAEFKHGPNTILGKNTVFGLQSLEAVLSAYAGVLRDAPEAERKALLAAAPSAVLAKNPGILEAGFGNYPLVFVCPPDERDIRITISQIHTHKIRGADILLVAEKRPELALAVEGKPANDPNYRSLYLEIPSTGDRDLFVFSATLVLQWLAFRMSVRKGAYLDGLGVQDHGVHPDVPKNVSKSITVD
ncbi:MAG TPA: hypothetical protein P5117_09155, partial [Spirochaetia bacterium]|nr:hypothetical protein [Spirochaetia bacterium]